MNTTTKEIETGLTLYEMNRSAMANQKPITDKALKVKLKTIAKPFFARNNTYFMLLCHEARDYTVFRKKSVNAADTAAKDLGECLINRGEVLGIDLDEYGTALEIWIKAFSDNEVHAYYLFPYDTAIIEC